MIIFGKIADHDDFAEQDTEILTIEASTGDPYYSPQVIIRPNYPDDAFLLYVRQQPSPARVSGSVCRDRRVIDPCPIVQMIPLRTRQHSHAFFEDAFSDVRYAVICMLFSENPSQQSREENLRQVYPLSVLSGKSIVSPFFVNSDPDPASSPFASDTSQVESSKYLPGISRDSRCIFFIFSDISISRGGLYRLKFQLIHWGGVENTQQPQPVLAETWSARFIVHPAREFPGLPYSSFLSDRLKELGAPEIQSRDGEKGRGRKKCRPPVYRS